MTTNTSTATVLPLPLPVNSDLSTHVFYSCGSCGYDLNLNSCNRNLTVIGETYGKSMKRGLISFYSIDQTRFTQTTKLRWWRIFRRRRTKLLCRNCDTCIGTCPSSSSKMTTWDGMSTQTLYQIKIRSLRPLDQ
ncbi:uncharacterized protein At4g08330, chloroplastic-like [Andrographis paniculata]|uniref:uncharacterized protein At4g08330, chloroplastic-like n=1 Tax=Andrographis paniculata TaxID=175694 RepID=UPI0021E7D5E6|nr:uncharacterized protein At4g08330, chloroplastic-like [Andrographis paniculata]